MPVITFQQGCFLGAQLQSWKGSSLRGVWVGERPGWVWPQGTPQPRKHRTSTEGHTGLPPGINPPPSSSRRGGPSCARSLPTCRGCNATSICVLDRRLVLPPNDKQHSVLTHSFIHALSSYCASGDFLGTGGRTTNEARSLFSWCCRSSEGNRQQTVGIGQRRGPGVQRVSVCPPFKGGAEREKERE